MEDLTSIFAGLESVVLSFEDSFATNILGVAKRIFASVRACLHREVTPQRFERFERRLECLFRELARQLLERTVNQIETSCRPQPVTWEHRATGQSTGADRRSSQSRCCSSAGSAGRRLASTGRHQRTARTFWRAFVSRRLS